MVQAALVGRCLANQRGRAAPGGKRNGAPPCLPDVEVGRSSALGGACALVWADKSFPPGA
jgi:hypothetical protein